MFFLNYKKPIIKENTFLIWEPCSQSHAENIPSYTKYLVSLGYHVSVLITPERYDEGVFHRFDDKNISHNRMSQREIRKFLKKDNLNNVKGVLITTAGKLYNGKDFNKVYKYFNKNIDKSKLFFVEHDIQDYFDHNLLSSKDDFITVRETNYKNAKTVVVNPHYFGYFKINKKNKTTRFISIGALSDKRRSKKLLVNAAQELLIKKITDFKIVVIGKGDISDLPKDLQPYFEIKGRLNFDKMYDEIEKSDFILTAYEDNQAHFKYITTKTSGAFQLSYGFLKPIIIKSNFAPINGLNNQNAILYNESSNYSDALIKAIEMSQQEYSEMQNNLKNYAESLYNESRENLKELINKKK